MDCQKCQELLSDFVDGTISAPERAVLSAHLGECTSCFGVRDELAAIVNFCREHRGDDPPVPNERALWLRISNVVEGELKAGRAATRPATAGSWWLGLLNRRWEMTLPQMAMTVAAVIIVASLGTVLSLRLTGAGVAGPVAVAPPSAPLVRNAEDMLRRQQVAIDYWNRRVEERKGRWNPQMREAFDRNMNVIDMTVNDALTGLRTNPHDDVAEEMLNAALSEKMELLQEFSDL